MWIAVLIILLKRCIDTNKKTDPMITCSPWNPVAIKKLDPKEESAIQKGASAYSKNWNMENTTPRKIVRYKAKLDFFKLLFNISWWAQVTVTPEDSRRIVLSKGILMGLKGWIERGGHLCPNSIVGEMLLWKKAQKKEAKKNTSDVIKRIIPVLSPFITKSEWFPWAVASRWMSRHHE